MIDGFGETVSRETLEKLRAFEDLVKKWTTKINLISKSTIPDIWNRHIIDSAQLFSLAPSSGHWVDLGSGGGFPGIVAAIMTQGTQMPHHLTLVESDQRKCAFLRTAIRELSLDVEVISKRIEDISPLEADVLSARALADLETLLGFSQRHLLPGGTALFPKGARWKNEDQEARIRWSYDSEPIISKTDPNAAILKIKNISHV
jgi:16S rRNA (guanine527-N7)-methyltransferase